MNFPLAPWSNSVQKFTLTPDPPPDPPDPPDPEATTGTLLVALPLFTLSWALFDGHWPTALDRRSAGAILYLALFGSALGFVLYYYVLLNVQATRVALITLVTPVIALLLGQWLNGESVAPREWLGTGIILTGLACFQWGGYWSATVHNRSAEPEGPG